MIAAIKYKCARIYGETKPSNILTNRSGWSTVYMFHFWWFISRQLENFSLPVCHSTWMIIFVETSFTRATFHLDNSSAMIVQSREKSENFSTFLHTGQCERLFPQRCLSDIYIYIFFLYFGQIHKSNANFFSTMINTFSSKKICIQIIYLCSTYLFFIFFYVM